jgi:hypothetical protein
METTHIGMTVFSRYPTPNGRNPPSRLYMNPGLTKCMIPKTIKKRRIAIDTLWVLNVYFVKTIG